MNLMTAIQVVVFVMGTIFIAFVSRRSLLSLEYHGFYRFFVFEFTLVLILINFPHWFSEPFSIHQIISWIFLFYSLLLIVQSVYFIRNFGGSKMNRDNSANLEFENTTNLRCYPDSSLNHRDNVKTGFCYNSFIINCSVDICNTNS